jgi:hypothetical protein
LAVAFRRRRRNEPAARNSFQGSTRALPIRFLLRLLNVEEQEEGRVFRREEIAAITAAFKQLLLDFKLVDRDDAVVTMLAKLVIELARNGERDPERLRAAVLKGLSLYPRYSSAFPLSGVTFADPLAVPHSDGIAFCKYRVGFRYDIGSSRTFDPMCSSPFADPSQIIEAVESF